MVYVRGDNPAAAAFPVKTSENLSPSACIENNRRHEWGTLLLVLAEREQILRL